MRPECQILADFACFLAYQPRLESCYNCDMKRSILLTVLTSLSLIAAVVSISQASSIGPIGPTEPPSPNKIAGWVIDQTSGGAPTEFLVVMADQADLSGADKLPTKAEKGRFVYDTLWTKAQSTQKR